MNIGVFGLSDSSVPELNCAENMKIAKAFLTLLVPRLFHKRGDL